MADTDADDGPIAPELVDSRQSLGPDRRLLIYVIVLPYVVFCAAVLYAIVLSSIEEPRLTLAASTILAPLGTLAGGIIAYYFRSS
jgi:hypothetical protein